MSVRVPLPRLPRTAFQSCKPKSARTSTCFALPTSFPRFLTARLESRCVASVSATVPLCFWLRTRLLRVALASSVTSSLSTLRRRISRRGLLHLRTSIISHPLHSSLPIACAACHLSVQALWGAFDSAGVEMPDDAWTSTVADHLGRCGGDASVHTAHSWLVTALAEITCKVPSQRTRGWRRGSNGSHDVNATPK
jgi:hypothetical protein